jgi:cyclic beta-1,2-glucan synthetase
MMKKGTNKKIVRSFLDRLVSRPKSPTDEPLRSELFSVEQMQHYGRMLAETHLVSKSHSHNDKLLARLVENESKLNEVRDLFAEAAAEKRRIFPAADWLLDNFYLIEEHIYTSKRDLPKGYSRGLPILLGGQSASLPRVYDIALERISHEDGLVDPDTLQGFLDSYQSVSVLTIGELWAIPIMLRLALIENLRRVAVRISAEMHAQSEADSWAERMIESAESDPKNLILLIADMARSDPQIVSSFVAELARKLQGKGSALALPLTWIEQRLSETGLTIEQLVQSELQQQAADQVSISNSIRGLRSLAATDWKQIVESTSAVDKILLGDPSGCYGKMDFATRDQYRHAVEETARRGRLPEESVARFALQLAQKGCDSAGKNDRSAHIGYYLVDKGFDMLLRTAQVRGSGRFSYGRCGTRRGLILYTGSVLSVSAVVSAGLVMLAYNGGSHGGSHGVLQWLIVLPAFVCACGLSIALLNWIVTLFAVPQILPRMDFSGGIPASSRTLVVVPSMLSSARRIEYLAETLEIRFLANRDDNLLFGLLTDFQDSKEQTAESDETLLSLVQQKITDLNDRYRGDSGDQFFLFHRPRQWNDRERVWMGYERKRGKLAALNSLLRGGTGDSFESIIGSIEPLQAVKYVITLDTDTQLPRDSARQLAGIMAHPLNRPVFDENQKRIVDGYGILQPRVAAGVSGARPSYYTIMTESETGIDPYTRAVSDVYQDLFREGAFIGKGIYDVDAFEQVLRERFPEDRILSHDLLEGCYARSGLVSDVQLYEESPVTYYSDVSRRLRWMRGDWQIARWLFPTVPSFGGGTGRNTLSGLSKWKILDNLRRSLMSLSLVFLFIFGWTVLPDPFLWMLAVFGIILIPPLLISFVDFFRKPHDMPVVPHIVDTARSLLNRMAQSLFTIVCLPYEAFTSLVTIVSTVFRILVTHRHLLEWLPSAEHGNDKTSLASSFKLMWAAPAAALSAAVFLFIFRAEIFFAAVPLLVLWLTSPLLVWTTSLTPPERSVKTSGRQNEFIGRLARKTWAFFETFVNDGENWLPPDNYQEEPAPKIAHRTSPTNIGLSLLSNLTACDLGYIPIGLLLDRTGHTIQTMGKLERYRDHFYNWYDTLTLQPLLPRYISSVDSGNLAAHLLTLSVGLSALSHGKILNPRIPEGLHDTAQVLAGFALQSDASAALSRFEEQLESAGTFETYTIADAHSFLIRLALSAEAVKEKAVKDTDERVAWWADALVRQVHDSIAELDHLVPWLAGNNAPDGRAGFVRAAGLLTGTGTMPTLQELYEQETELLRIPADVPQDGSSGMLEQLIRDGCGYIEDRLAEIDNLVRRIEEFALMDFTFLYSKNRHLFSIGYNVDSRRRDTGFYDLLASEARLTSFIAIAQEQVPQENWFALGRSLASIGGKSTLFSWSGSMFEYLMPNLVMPSYENTLLQQTCRRAVERQIEYGQQRGIPWGISESGYNSFDVTLNYQYRAFGVPGLGLKRGLIDDLVVAPYATALALMIMPEKACLNLQRLSEEGSEGDYGFYEAIDYTESRVPTGQSNAIVHSFMAHHQGMSLLSFSSHLLGQLMQKRFGSIPQVRATTLLLEERIPRATRFSALAVEIPDFRAGMESVSSSSRTITNPDTATPEVHLLSNGRYHVMVTNAGSGYSRWKDIAVTRWVEDSAVDNKGTFLYVRDVETGELWSNSYQPVCKKPDSYEAIFSEGRAEFRRRDNDFDVYTEITVSPEDDIELRRVRITNLSHIQRTLEITSYAEVVLTSASSDASHPGFSNLFVQTEILDEQRTILCTRRPRSDNEQTPWMIHLMTARDARVIDVSYETDRLQFIGRGKTVEKPAAVNRAGPLSGSSGSVLDPVVAIRQRIRIDPESTATVDLITGIGDTRASAVRLAEKYQDKRFANRAFELARTHSQVILQQINGTEADAQLYSRFTGFILYAHSRLRAAPGIIRANTRGQSGLWGYSISGDLPIVLLQIKDPANIDLVRRLVQAHSYWRQKGLPVDLMIWNEDRDGYRQQLHNQIEGLITAGVKENASDQSGGIFVRSAEQISAEDRILIQSAARVIISDSRGTLEEQTGGIVGHKPNIPLLIPVRASKNRGQSMIVPRSDLLFFNGFGGFAPDGREYIITLARGQVTPAPWTNVLANPDFGTVVSEAGSAYTWSENAHEFRLTPWYDDPVCDTSGEALYVRDEESGQFWSPSPLPRRGETPYVARHGFGYSVFEHSEWGISTELWIYVATDAPVKFSVLKVRNESGRTRRLSATSYAELVLGELRSKSVMHIITEVDGETGAVFARNRYSREFPERVVFHNAAGKGRTVTGDRTEFIGRNGSLGHPDAMLHEQLSGITGAALDPCAAIQIPFELADGQSREIVFTLGAGSDAADAGHLARRFNAPGAAREALENVWRYWRQTLDAVRVETPDDSLNVLVNGWLMYQILSSRMWGRSGYYQSGGAFGFRDQLQDAMTLVHTEPDLFRRQLVLCASRQFPEGDVQHWWHPPKGRGVRTHCSDDYLWLPLAVCRYVSCTGDSGVLDEMIPFLQGRAVNPDEESYYDLPEQSGQAASLYNHCVLAIQHGTGRGVHGLPLIGSGDWNDGMNRVGEKGKGESVWLAFFLYEVLNRFSGLSLEHGDRDFSGRCIREAEQLRTKIEEEGWDGQWYRRAYFDDGSLLGSADNSECRIDSIAQSWSVLSGAGNKERSRMAMDALDNHLVRREKGLIQLLDPPFDTEEPNPGYIRGYVPGVRENGGQYTHAAIWATMAFARMGDTKRAWELFTMINPVNHSNSPEKAEIYKVEPYVMAADVYSIPPHTGRGGWTWYTGSAGWMYRLITESLLGVSLEADRLRLSPCIPADWAGFKLHYRYRETMYHIAVKRTPAGSTGSLITIDGVQQTETTIVLIDDHTDHQVEIRIST